MYKADFVLLGSKTLNTKQQCICFGEVKVKAKLMDGKEPKELVQLWAMGDTTARAVLAQSFTYMQVWTGGGGGTTVVSVLAQSYNGGKGV
jgi:hypothetical protein